jgi:hypothetical protein
VVIALFEIKETQVLRQHKLEKVKRKIAAINLRRTRRIGNPGFIRWNNGNIFSLQINYQGNKKEGSKLNHEPL